MDHWEKAEVRRILEAAKKVRERDWIFLGLWYTDALRVTEVVTLTRDSVDDGNITLQREKGSKRTSHPIWTDPDPVFNLAPAVAAYVRLLRPKGRLFPFCRQQGWRLLRKYQKAAGVRWPKGIRGVLKHSVAMNHIDEIGLLETSQYLGHRQIRTTMKYVASTDRKAAEALARARGAKTPS